jgi:hypothetical protein
VRKGLEVVTQSEISDLKNITIPGMGAYVIELR